MAEPSDARRTKAEPDPAAKKARAPAGARGGTAASTNIGELVGYLDREALADDGALAWPPNAFALAGSLLQRSGAYCQVLRAWPPRGAGGLPAPPQGVAWSEWIRKIGQRWREAAITGGRCPDEVAAWWRHVVAARDLPLVRAAEDRSLCDALLQISAAADEASIGVGFPGKGPDPYLVKARLLLRGGVAGSTLASRIDALKVRVLPKQHTPRQGMTMRSLSHHLALYSSADVVPRWRDAPRAIDNTMNLLVVPWPTKLARSQFQPCAPVRGALSNMPERFAFFEYRPKDDPKEAGRRMAALLRSAEEIGGRVDGVILPELALTRREYLAVRPVVLRHGAFLLSGIVEPPPRAGVPGKNYVALDAGAGSYTSELVRQEKHHRWRLDRSQVEMYGLFAQLDPSREWWEHTEIGKREVHFVPLSDSVTICCLICEDLARQDPVAELVRSVGPNLVVALLMDAPQLGARWPARYATVLADDPGCSVLTVTSAGMVDLSRPPPGAKASRSIALWKDARSPRPTEIELPLDAEAVLLSLCNGASEEWTADGRSDGGQGIYPELAGFHPIRRPPPA